MIFVQTTLIQNITFFLNLAATISSPRLPPLVRHPRQAHPHLVSDESSCRRSFASLPRPHLWPLKTPRALITDPSEIPSEKKRTQGLAIFCLSDLKERSLNLPRRRRRPPQAPPQQRRTPVWSQQIDPAANPSLTAIKKLKASSLSLLNINTSLPSQELRPSLTTKLVSAPARVSPSRFAPTLLISRENSFSPARG